MPFALKSLQEVCMMVIIKHELSRDRLPDSVIEEVDQFERKILSFFTGKFCTYTNRMQYEGNVFSVKLDQDHGGLEFIFEKDDLEDDHLEWIKEAHLIMAGRKNKLGKLGTNQFMLPGREVFIYDFRIDLEKKEINLLGSCSSIVKDCDNHPLKINLCWYPDDDESASLRIETMLYSESDEGLYPLFWKRIFSFRSVSQTLEVNQTLNQSSESESEPDMESSDYPESESEMESIDDPEIPSSSHGL